MIKIVLVSDRLYSKKLTSISIYPLISIIQFTLQCILIPPHLTYNMSIISNNVTTISQENLNSISTELQKKTINNTIHDTIQKKLQAYLFSSHYESSETALRALLADGFKGKHAQAWIAHYSEPGLLDTSDALLHVLNLMRDPLHVDRVPRILSIMHVITDEIENENEHIKDAKFTSNVIPEITRMASEVMHVELSECMTNINRTNGIQDAHKSYVQLQLACVKLVDNYDLYATTTLLINSPDIAINTNNTKTYTHVLNDRHKTFKRICDTATLKRQRYELLDGIVLYIKGNLQLCKLIDLIVIAKKEDRDIVESWDLEEICRYVNLSEDGFTTGEIILTKLCDSGCKDGTGYREVLAKPLINWLTRSFFAYIYAVSRDTNIIPEDNIIPAITTYLSKYKSVWGRDPPFVDLGKQIMSIGLGLQQRKMIAISLKHIPFGKLSNNAAKLYKIYLDYTSNYRYNFTLNCCPATFDTALVIRSSSPREDYEKFKKENASGKITAMSHIQNTNSIIHEIQAHLRFATYIQDLMIDGDILMPTDASFMCLDS